MADPPVKDASASSVPHDPPDSHVKDASASSVLHDPPNSHVNDTSASSVPTDSPHSVVQINKVKEPEIREITGQHNVPGGDGDPDMPRLVEAGPAEPWFEAIEKKDCLSLMHILEERRSYELQAPLCLRTGKEGRTALHVAAMQGCFPLAKQVIDYMGKQVADYKVKVNGASRNPDDFIDAKDGRSGLTAFEMANDVIGNRSITQYINYLKKMVEADEVRSEDYEVFFEAYPGTEWCTALAEGDCKMLKILLQCNTRYLLETCDGFTVLDVAILKDDENLLQWLLDAFGSNQSINWGASYFPPELLWFQMMGPRLLHEIRHAGLKDTFLGKTTCEEVGLINSATSAKELAEKLKRPKSINTLKMDKTREVDTKLLKHLDSIIQDLWKPEWDEGFLADVDYNFEAELSLRKSILRFHYACKDLKKFAEYILATIYNTGGPKFDRSILICLCLLHDGQGRTPFHTMVEYYNHENHSDLTFEKLLLPGELKSQNSMWRLIAMEFLSYSHDSSGRFPSVRAITKQYYENKSMVSTHLVRFYETLRTKLNDHGDFKKTLTYNMEEWKVRKGRSWNDVWLFNTSLFFQDEHVQRQISQENEPSALERLNFLYGRDAFKSNANDSSHLPVLLAAAAGNQTLLRWLLKTKFDPMIVDKEGKTALHYAADVNMFKFFPPPLQFYCSICDRRKVDDKWMKKQKEDIQPDMNQNAQLSVGRRACILMLLQAGVDLSQEDKHGDIPDPGITHDASFQNWWYDTLVKDTIDKKNNFNLAGNALSVVGTLVAATSYIGPLQPPLNYNDIGYVETSKVLVKVFMMSNTLAFYLAVASVMFAVVPSLPMPQEGVIDELRRARHTVSSSLCLLLASIGCILVSFAAASAVVVENEHYYGPHDFLLSPSIIGWFFCLIAIVSFFIRVMRLIYYKNTLIRHIYKISFNALFKKIGSVVQRLCAPICKFSYFVFLFFYGGVQAILYLIFHYRRGGERLEDYLIDRMKIVRI